MKAILVTICILAGVAIFAVIAFMMGSNKGEVIIKNASTELITGGTLKICNQQFKLSNIEPNGVEHIAYRVRSDSHYSVVIEFQSGKKLEKDIGYVTSGADFRDQLLVQDTDIVLQR